MEEILSKDNSVASLATDFENLGDNIAYAIREIAKLTKGFTDLVSNPTFKAGLLAIAIASKSPKAVAAAFTIVGGSAVLGAATSARQLSPEENSALARARIINRRLEARIIALSTGKRKEEYEILDDSNSTVFEKTIASAIKKSISKGYLDSISVPHRWARPCGVESN